MSKLFADESSDSEGELKINDGYAKNYNNWRQKEELNKIKTKYGKDLEEINSGDSSDSTEEDEDGTAWNDQMDKEFFKTLTYLTTKDPKIHDKNVTFFSNPETENVTEKTKKVKKEKTLFLKDYERDIIMKKDGKFSDSEEENTSNFASRTYVQEQQELKDSLRKATQDINDDNDFLKPKQKSETKEEKLQIESDYKEWLKGGEAEIENDLEKELKPLRDFWSNPKLDKDEKFLRDYVLNKMHLEENTSKSDDYELKLHDSDENLSEDEKNIKKQEEFETKYNFRFEEPDQEFIKRYPRTFENSLRRKDTRRAEKRAEVKKRKEEEKVQKREELKQLKAVKRKELQERIEKLKEVTGNDDLRFDVADLEGDFDPNEHEKRMNELFNDEYYADVEEMKPEDHDIDTELGLDCNWDDYDPNTDSGNFVDTSAYGPHCEDPEFNMDADYDKKKDLEAELVDSSKKRKRRRKSKFSELISKDKPKYDPSSHPSYQEYFDQYYALNCEDMIGDLPCRFKWHEVVPNNYGLSVDEIMMADDRELNKWCSLKKALQYRPEHLEMNDVKIYKQKASNDGFKRKILTSLYKPPEIEEKETEVASTSESSKKKKKRKKKKTVEVAEVSTSVEKSKKRKLSDDLPDTKENKTEEEESNVSSKKNKKRKLAESAETVIESQNIKKKKKKKNSDANSSLNSTNKEKSPAKKISGAEGVEKVTKQKQLKNKGKKQKTKKAHVQKGLNDVDEKILSISDDRFKMYGLNPKKFKNKLKYAPKK